MPAAQLATVLIAITALAITSLADQCVPAPALLPAPNANYTNYILSYVQLGAGVETYNCNMATGTYESILLNLQLFDARCLNSTDYFNHIAISAQDYQTHHPHYSINDLEIFISESFGLYSDGELASTDRDDIQIYISDNNPLGQYFGDVRIVYQDQKQMTLWDGDNGVNLGFMANECRPN